MRYPWQSSADIQVGYHIKALIVFKVFHHLYIKLQINTGKSSSAVYVSSTGKTHKTVFVPELALT